MTMTDAVRSSARPRPEPGFRKDPGHTGVRLAGFFPGLGSRAFYRGIGSRLLRSGSAAVTGVHTEAAGALGIAGHPAAIESLVDTAAGKLDRQAAVGVSVLVDSLALHAQLRDRAVSFATYTGESFGMLTAAVAADALSIADATLIAHAFTPLALLCAGERDGGRAQDDLLRHVPASVRDHPVVSEPHHVIGLRAATPAALADVLAGLRDRFGADDVEPHKNYSPRQCNVYVRAGAHAAFRTTVHTAHPNVDVVELKDPTTFVVHSARMRPARVALAEFLAARRIEFADPRVPLVSNSGGGLLRTAAAVRAAVLDMTDTVMNSHGTCRQLDALDLDAVLELGPGGKSVDLLRDNEVRAAARTAPLTRGDADRLAGSIAAIHDLHAHVADLRRSGATGTDAAPHLPVVRRAIEATAADETGRELLSRHAAALAPRDDEREPGQAFARCAEILQHTLAHGRHLDRGEVAVRARLRKPLSTQLPPAPAGTRLQLAVTAPDGSTTVRHVETDVPEVQVVHLGRGAGGVDDESVVLGQYQAFQEIATNHPALLAHADVCLHATDSAGRLAALAVSGALPLAAAVALCRGESSVDAAAGRIGPATIPIIAPDGVPVQSHREMLTILHATADRPASVIRLRLNGNCHVLSLGPDLDAATVDAGPHAVTALTAPGAGHALAGYERDCLLRLTREHAMVLATATSRRITVGTVNAYVEPTESIVGFGKGGSESMTIFVRKDGEDHVTVRKVLSESLTTASWRPDGTGVMLPPFAKARKQAEFLQHLPVPLRRYFPRVLRTHEHTIHVPVGDSTREYRSAREVSYEMSYVGGDEVSGFVRRWSPPPAVVARLYEVIIRLLRDTVHSTGRTVPATETLETSYFRKIEDRLDLCRRTAPRTFGPALLDSEYIVIDGISYLNAATLLRRFRADPRHRAVLEPHYHSLVVGDTNTENIKIGDTTTLLHAQRVIENAGSAADVAAALRAVTADSLDLRFLDPRAIGFAGDGRDTRDDPMYDNKPWHNSLGHYDEIHFEHFDLAVDVNQATPRIGIRFTEDNPYARAYRVRDVNVNGGRVDPTDPRGLEDHFAPVMTAALDLADPDRSHASDDPFWLVRFVFVMGQHFTAMPPFHFTRELDGTLLDDHQNQRRPVAIYCEGVKWLNWSLQMLEGTRTEFLGLPVALPADLPTSRHSSTHHTEESSIA